MKYTIETRIKGVDLTKKAFGANTFGEVKDLLVTLAEAYTSSYGRDIVFIIRKNGEIKKSVKVTNLFVI
jgi:hypothetical protein